MERFALQGAVFAIVCLMLTVFVTAPTKAAPPFPERGTGRPLCIPGYVWVPEKNVCAKKQPVGIYFFGGPPQPSVAGETIDIEPDAEADMQISVTWRPGMAAPQVDDKTSSVRQAQTHYYKVCFWDGGSINADCDGTAVPQQIFTNIPASRTSATFTLDHRQFQGRSFTWSVAACTCQRGLLARTPGTCHDPAPQKFDSPGCKVATGTKRVFWKLPPPSGLRVTKTAPQGGSSTNHPYDAFTFSWSPVWARTYYRLCLYRNKTIDTCLTRPLDGSTSRDANPMYVFDSARTVRVDYDLPQFRGETINWTVAACAADLPPARRCRLSAQQTLDVGDPLTPPVINQLSISPELEDGAQIRLGWTLADRANIKFVRLCIADLQQAGNLSRADVLGFCRSRNQIVNPDRASKPTGCAMDYPFFRGQFGTDPVLWAFMAAVCNKKNECFWSTDYVGAAYQSHSNMRSSAICN